MADIEKKDIDKKDSAAPAEKAEAKKPAKDKKSDKPSAFARMGAWFRSCKSEMKKVVWASPKTVVRNSVMVLISVAVVAIAIALLDAVFSLGITGLSDIF